MQNEIINNIEQKKEFLKDKIKKISLEEKSLKHDLEQLEEARENIPNVEYTKNKESIEKNLKRILLDKVNMETIKIAIYYQEKIHEIEALMFTARDKQDDDEMLNDILKLKGLIKSSLASLPEGFKKEMESYNKELPLSSVLPEPEKSPFSMNNISKKLEFVKIQKKNNKEKAEIINAYENIIYNSIKIAEIENSRKKASDQDVIKDMDKDLARLMELNDKFFKVVPASFINEAEKYATSIEQEKVSPVIEDKPIVMKNKKNLNIQKMPSIIDPATTTIIDPAIIPATPIVKDPAVMPATSTIIDPAIIPATPIVKDPAVMPATPIVKETVTIPETSNDVEPITHIDMPETSSEVEPITHIDMPETPSEVEPITHIDMPETSSEAPLNDNKSEQYMRADAIIEDLTEGLIFKPKDGKRYAASNIQIGKGFYNAIHTGNAIYNITGFIPAAFAVIRQFPVKYINKLLLGISAKERIRTLEERLDDIPFDDQRWETLATGTLPDGRKTPNFAYYAHENKLPQAVVDAVNKKVASYLQNKANNINNELMADYKCAILDYRQIEKINNLLQDSTISARERADLQVIKLQLLDGKAKLISGIRQKQAEGAQILNGNGIHALSEDTKSVNSRMSLIGMGLNKQRGTVETSRETSNLGIKEEQAITENDDFLALSSFVELETLKAKNSNVERTILGRLSTGDVDYHPLATSKNYQNDPLLRNIFSTIMIASTITNVYNSINNSISTRQMIDEYNSKLAKVNENNKAMEGNIHSNGAELTGNTNDYINGINAQQRGFVEGQADLSERVSLDKTQWNMGAEYRTLDKAAHESFNNLYNKVNESYTNIKNGLESGTLTPREALDMSVQNANQVNQTYVSLCKDAIGPLQTYASSHPECNLSGVIESVKYLGEHPDDIVKMNEALLGTSKIGESLTNIQLQYMENFKDLPIDIASPLLAAGSLAILLGNTTNQLSRECDNMKEESDIVNLLLEDDTNEDESSLEIKDVTEERKLPTSDNLEDLDDEQTRPLHELTDAAKTIIPTATVEAVPIRRTNDVNRDKSKLVSDIKDRILGKTPVKTKENDIEKTSGIENDITSTIGNPFDLAEDLGHVKR